MTSLKKTLPPSTAEAQGIGSILDSCGSELEELEQEARAACMRLAAGTADEAGCALWERELGLESRADLPLEARRVLIRIALDGRNTCTPQRMRELLRRMLGGEATLTERFSEYRLELTAQAGHFSVPSLLQVKRTLRAAVPAHLAVDLQVAAEVPTRDACRRVQLPGLMLDITTEEELT